MALAVGSADGIAQIPRRHSRSPLTLTLNPTRGVAVDQSSLTGHVFTLSATGSGLFFPFSEYDSSGAPVPGSPFGGELISGDSNGAHGIAYSPARDWVYTSERNSGLAEWANVKAFGPVASGTAPDVSSEKTTAVGETEATFHGKIEPHGVPNSYHFEWTKAEAQRSRSKPRAACSRSPSAARPPAPKGNTPTSPTAPPKSRK